MVEDGNGSATVVGEEGKVGHDGGRRRLEEEGSLERKRCTKVGRNRGRGKRKVVTVVGGGAWSKTKASKVVARDGEATG